MSKMEQLVRLVNEPETTEQKALLVCTAAMFGNMSHQATLAGNDGLANACGYATTVLERMALGEIPIFVGQDNDQLIQLFEEQVEETRKQLRQQGIDPMTMQPIQPQTINGEATEVVEPNQEN